MGIFSNGSEPQPTPQRRRTDGIPFSIIAPDMTVVGDLQTEGIVKIEGRIRGTVRAAGQILLTEGAVIEGDLYAGEAVISGEVQGNIEATDRVELQATALVRGDLVTARIAVQEGARVTGAIKMDAQKVAEYAGTSPQ